MRKIILALSAITIFSGCTPQYPSGHSSRPDNAIIRGVNYVGVVVSDIERSASFYQEFGNTTSVEKGEFHQHSVIDELAGRTGVHASTQLIKSSNAQLRLMEFANPSAAAKTSEPVQVFGPGIAHLCFQVAKDTQSYQRFLKAGGTHIGHPEIQLNPRTQVAYAYAHDLDKSVVEIEHVDVNALMEAGHIDAPPKNEYRIRHISLATPNINRLTKFYSQLLQEDEVRRTSKWMPAKGEMIDRVSGEKGAKLQFSWIQVRNMELEMIQYVSHSTELPEQPRPLDAVGYNMIMFDVSDLKTARDMFVAAGGTVVLEKNMDGVMTLFGRDPDGNLLGFQTLANNATLSSQNFANNGL